MKSRLVSEKGMVQLITYLILNVLLTCICLDGKNCAFIDYRKAFDSVDRILLWQKLLRTSIDGNMLVIIQNMYKNAKSCDRDGSNCSDFFHQILV